MKFFKLKGKTRHGKTRINQHGDLWAFESVSDEVRFATKAPGPWLTIKSVSCDCNVCKKWGQDFRIISERDDENFEIVEVIEQ